MRAFQVIEFATPIVARDLPYPQPQAGEVIVEVSSCGLCHTDAHIHQGHFSLGGDQKLPVSAMGVTTPATLGQHKCRQSCIEGVPARAGTNKVKGEVR